VWGESQKNNGGKSAYQLISELIKNNIGNSKQIEDFLAQCKDDQIK